MEFFQKSNFPELASKSSEIHSRRMVGRSESETALSKAGSHAAEMETAFAKELTKAAELRDAISF